MYLKGPQVILILAWFRCPIVMAIKCTTYACSGSNPPISITASVLSGL